MFAACFCRSVRRYYANWTAPRPESYREDAELARNVTGTDSPDNPATAALYRELASGAESGWDYSSRWFADMATMETIRTTQVCRQRDGTSLSQPLHRAVNKCKPEFLQTLFMRSMYTKSCLCPQV